MQPRPYWQKDAIGAVENPRQGPPLEWPSNRSQGGHCGPDVRERPPATSDPPASMLDVKALQRIVVAQTGDNVGLRNFTDIYPTDGLGSPAAAIERDFPSAKRASAVEEHREIGVPSGNMGRRLHCHDYGFPD